jgi:hypothetical protein
LEAAETLALLALAVVALGHKRHQCFCDFHQGELACPYSLRLEFESEDQKDLRP